MFVTIASINNELLFFPFFKDAINFVHASANVHDVIVAAYMYYNVITTDNDPLKTMLNMLGLT